MEELIKKKRTSIGPVDFILLSFPEIKKECISVVVIQIKKLWAVKRRNTGARKMKID